MTATYLLRFDDLCPTMRWDVWDEIERILVEAGVCPILSVVPDNRDAYLEVEPPAPGFWDRVRSWDERGWVIGMHGYQHTYVTEEAGIVGINAMSEFAGLPAGEQRHKLVESMSIFRREGVTPRVWVAPGHSFDAATLEGLRAIGVNMVSDGLSLYPYRDSAGMIWLPQQLWRFRRLHFGVWTVCCHHNRWTPERLRAFERGLASVQRQMGNPDEVAERYARRTAALPEAVLPQMMRWGLRQRMRFRALRTGAASAAAAGR